MVAGVPPLNLADPGPPSGAGASASHLPADVRAMLETAGQARLDLIDGAEALT